MTAGARLAGATDPWVTGGRWASGPCVALGQRFTVDAPADDPALVARLAALVAPLRPADGNPGDETLPVVAYRLQVVGGTPTAPRYRLDRDGRPVDEPGTADFAARLLAWDVNQSAVAAARRHHTVLHAGAVAVGADVVLLAAPMEHGKTTTTAGLLTCGWDYVTDEAVALDRTTLGIGAFPKALSLDTGSWPLFPEARPAHAAVGDGQWLVPCTAFGARVAAGPLLPRLVLLPRYVAGAATQARRLHPADALYRLAQCCFGFPAGGATDLATLAQLVRACPVVELLIGSLAEAVTLVADLARRCGIEPPEQRTSPPPSWAPPAAAPAGATAPGPATLVPHPASAAAAPGPPVSLDDVPVRPRDTVVHVLDGEAVALGPTGDLHRLDRPATLVWERFDGSVPVGRVAGTLAVALGADPDVVRRDVLQVVSAMVDRGLLALRG